MQLYRVRGEEEMLKKGKRKAKRAREKGRRPPGDGDGNGDVVGTDGGETATIEASSLLGEAKDADATDGLEDGLEDCLEELLPLRCTHKVRSFSFRCARNPTSFPCPQSTSYVVLTNRPATAPIKRPADRKAWHFASW